MTKAQRDIKRKLRVLNYAKEIGNISKACRYFGISRETYYQWKRAYEQQECRFLRTTRIVGLLGHPDKISINMIYPFGDSIQDA